MRAREPRYRFHALGVLGLVVLLLWALLFVIVGLRWSRSFQIDAAVGVFGILLIFAILAEWPWKRPGAVFAALGLRLLVVGAALLWIDSELSTYHLLREPFPEEYIVTERPRLAGQEGGALALSPFRSGLWSMATAIDVQHESARLPILLLALQAAAAGMRRYGWPVIETEISEGNPTAGA